MPKSLLLAGVALLTFSQPAIAYIDPVTGSVIVQALIGGAAAAMVAIRGVRSRILGLFRRRPLPDEKLVDEDKPSP